MNGIVYLQSVSAETWMGLFCISLLVVIPLLMIKNMISEKACFGWILLIFFYKCLDLGLPAGKGWVDLFGGDLKESEVIGMFFTSTIIMAGIVFIGMLLIKDLGRLFGAGSNRDVEDTRLPSEHTATVIKFPEQTKSNRS